MPSPVLQRFFRSPRISSRPFLSCLLLLVAALSFAAQSLAFAIAVDEEMIAGSDIELDSESEWYGQQDGPAFVGESEGEQASNTSILNAFVLWILLNPKEVSSDQLSGRKEGRQAGTKKREASSHALVAISSLPYSLSHLRSTSCLLCFSFRAPLSSCLL